MEFSEYDTHPLSPSNFLYNQVKEQSDLCDIIVKHGHWEKKYHWCVLVESPYFDNVRRNRDSFSERDAGIIHMKIGTPEGLENAILFLYGQEPTINEQNIVAVLEISEYLMIPTLKGRCVKWIRSSTATSENCLTMHRLASLHDFTLPASYEECLRGRIPELIWTEDMLDLTFESVEYLFTDPTLSYVSSQDKLSFLLRWLKCRSDRKPLFKGLVKHIEFEDFDKEYILNDVIKDPLILELDDGKELVNFLEQLNPKTSCDVIIFPQNTINDRMKCFDMTRERWYSVNVKSLNEQCQDRTHVIRSCQWQKGKESPQIYAVDAPLYNREASIITLDLEQNTAAQSFITVGLSDEANIRYRSEKTHLWNDEIFVISEDRAQCSKTENSASSVPRYRPTTFRFSTLYIGTIESEETIIHPMFCIREKISRISANESFVAMLPTTAEKLYMFNRKKQTLDTLPIENDKEEYRLAQIDNRGFVLYNNCCFVTIIIQFDPKNRHDYQMSKYIFSLHRTVENYYNEYLFCGNRWYNFSRSMCNRLVFSMTTHDKLIASIRARDEGLIKYQSQVWEIIDTDEYELSYSKIEKRLFQVRLPKDKLSCARACPHCILQRESLHREYYDYRDFGDEYYCPDTDSDDDYEYRYDDYGYRYDDYYYYDSD